MAPDVEEYKVSSKAVEAVARGGSLIEKKLLKRIELLENEKAILLESVSESKAENRELRSMAWIIKRYMLWEEVLSGATALSCSSQYSDAKELFSKLGKT